MTDVNEKYTKLKKHLTASLLFETRMGVADDIKRMNITNINSSSIYNLLSKLKDLEFASKIANRVFKDEFSIKHIRVSLGTYKIDKEIRNVLFNEERGEVLTENSKQNVVNDGNRFNDLFNVFRNKKTDKKGRMCNNDQALNIRKAELAYPKFSNKQEEMRCYDFIVMYGDLISPNEKAEALKMFQAYCFRKETQAETNKEKDHYNKFIDRIFNDLEHVDDINVTFEVKNENEDVFKTGLKLLMDKKMYRN